MHRYARCVKGLFCNFRQIYHTLKMFKQLFFILMYRIFYTIEGACLQTITWTASDFYFSVFTIFHIQYACYLFDLIFGYYMQLQTTLHIFRLWYTILDSYIHLLTAIYSFRPLHVKCKRRYKVLYCCQIQCFLSVILSFTSQMNYTIFHKWT